jgi:hypothetical protein
MFRWIWYRFRLTLWRDGFMNEQPLRSFTPAQQNWVNIGIDTLEAHANSTAPFPEVPEPKKPMTMGEYWTHGDDDGLQAQG